MKGLILGDELVSPLAQEFSYNPSLKVLHRAGATISSLTDSFLASDTFNPSVWEGVDFLWILIGTYDIEASISTQNFDVKSFLANYRHLVQMIRGHMRDILIVCSSIIPRLGDYELSKPIVKIVNCKLQKLCEDVCRVCKDRQSFLLSGYPSRKLLPCRS